MPLFLRALPLSIGTLWHYVFLFPLVVIVSIPFLLLTIIPILGLPVAMTIATFLSFAGYRCALAANGQGNEPSFGKLMKASFVFGLINLLGSMALFALSYGIGLGLERLGIGQNVTVPEGMEIPYATGLAGVIYLVLSSLFFCAVAVPMTAAAHAATSKGRDPGPLYGFGTGLFSLAVCWALWMVGLIYLGFLASIGEAMAYGIHVLISSTFGVTVDLDYEMAWATLAISVLYLLWGTCWFAATAVLAWDRKRTRAAEAKVEDVAIPRVSVDELRALREARMPGRPDQS